VAGLPPARGCARVAGDVHKNDTPPKPPLGNLARGVKIRRACRIDRLHRVVATPGVVGYADSHTQSPTATPPKGHHQRSKNVRAHRTLVLSAILALALAVPAVAAGKQLIIGGSTSVLPLMQKLAAAYHKEHRHIPEPRVSGGQSDIGIAGAANGSLDIGDSSRDPIVGVDPSGLQFTKIARDGVCIITNSHNPVPNLSQTDVEGIFTGKIHDWSEVSGAKVSGPIDLFQRTSASGTEDAFQHIFLGEYLKISPSAVAEASNGLEQLHVEKDEHAIGFVSFAYTGGVHPVPYQGVACNLRNARSGQYEGVRNFWMVTKGAPKGEAKKFIAWVTSGKKQVDRIINSTWIAVH
jgi:phosphate transport system substrate-binding protein